MEDLRYEIRGVCGGNASADADKRIVDLLNQPRVTNAEEAKARLKELGDLRNSREETLVRADQNCRAAQEKIIEATAAAKYFGFSSGTPR